MKDAKYEVAEEIKKLRDDIKYSERALRIARRMKQRIDDRQQESEESAKHQHKHSKKASAHEEEWGLIHDQDKEAERGAEDLAKSHESCPAAKIEKGPCESDGFRISTFIHFSQVGDECQKMTKTKRTECSVVEAMDFINANKKAKDEWAPEGEGGPGHPLC